MCRTFELYVWPPSWFFPLWATQRQQQHEIFFNAGCCCCCWRGLRSLFTPSHFGFGRLRLFFVLCLFKTTTKSVQFPLCTFHTQKESERERRRALIDFGASFVVCARRSLCSFSSARHIFLFPLCATLLPLRCLPACLCMCVSVSGSAYVCTCSTDTFTFSFFIFSACFCLAHTHTHTETDTRTPTLLCRFYNLSLLCVCVCVSVRARHV